jgi:hypothetical protein
MSLKVNTQKSGKIGGIGAAKLLVVVDGDTMEEVQSSDARNLALATADENGFGNGGLNDNPIIGAIDAETNEMLDDGNIKVALDPKRKLQGYRAEFTIAKRI